MTTRYEPTLQDIEGPLRERIAELEADLKVSKSRAEAYQVTCHSQGKKLLDVDKVLQLVDTSMAKDTPIHLRTFKDPFLRAIQQILIRKEH